MPTPTTEQAAIIAAALANNQSDNLLVEARAGTGKTTTIVQLVEKLSGNTLLLAYNKSIQRELQQRVPAVLHFTTAISTVHSFGLSCFRASGNKVKIEGSKLHFIWKTTLQTKRSFRERFNERQLGAALIPKIVSHAKNAGFGIDTRDFPSIEDTLSWALLISHFNLEFDLEEAGISIPDAIEMAQYLLLESNRNTGMIDFDDMIYLPLLFNLPIPQYDHVIIDEAQDISATRHELASRAMASRGRIIAVGDRYQAIYGFTGAMSDALDNISSRHAANILPLTVCWRCDEAIIKTAQVQVPDIQARPNAAPGSVTSITIDDLWDNPPAKGSAILCRLNKPNVAVCLAFIRQGISAKIEGRDIGLTILNHIKKGCPLYATTSLFEVLSQLQDYKEREVTLFTSRNKPTQAAYIADEIDAAILILERVIETGGSRFAEVEALVKTLFADDVAPASTITLSSVHKAKGREWPSVYILDAHSYMPFFMAELPWELQQEDNLIYVAKTRAEKNLIHVDGVKAWLDARSKDFG